MKANLILAGLVVVLTLTVMIPFLAFLGRDILQLFGVIRPYDRIAGYRQMSFRLGHDGFSEMYTGSLDGREPVADLWIQIRDIGVYRLPDVTQDIVSQVAECSPGQMRDDLIHCSRNGSSFTFRDRRLVYVSLTSYSGSLFQIGAAPQGPFYRLPIEEEIAHQLFGPPLEYRKRETTRP